MIIDIEEKLSQNKKGLLYVLSGPCGAGKTTLALKWHQNNMDTLLYTRSVTTRKARSLEEHYDYVDKSQFQKMIKDNKFVQWIHPGYDEFYGTLKEPIDSALQQGKDMVFDYCPEGYLNLKREYPENTVGIFIMADSLNTLSYRLKNRETETDTELLIRYDMALKDFNFVSEHKYHLVNNDINTSLKILESIRLAEKHCLINQDVNKFYQKHAKKVLLKYYLD